MHAHTEASHTSGLVDLAQIKWCLKRDSCSLEESHHTPKMCSKHLWRARSHFCNFCTQTCYEVSRISRVQNSKCMSEWRKGVGGHDIAHAHHHKSSGAPAWMETLSHLSVKKNNTLFLMDFSYPPPAPIVDSDPERWFGPCHCWSQYVDAAKKLAALLGALTAVQRLLTWPSGICTNFPGFPGSKKCFPKEERKMSSGGWPVGHVTDKWCVTQLSGCPPLASKHFSMISSLAKSSWARQVPVLPEMCAGSRPTLLL